MFDLIAGVIRYVIPIGAAATGETVGQSAGVLNVGLEGLMLTSSYAALVADLATGSPWIGLGAAIVAAVILGLIQTWFTLVLAADMVVVGTAVNLLALGLTSTLYRMRFGGGGQLLSINRLPQFGPWDAVMILMIVIVAGATFALSKTRWGLVVRASGEYPAAVKASGFSNLRVRLTAVTFGAIMAGLAGGYLTVGVTGSFSENMTAGRGFLALAMVTFGRWKPVWVVVAALLIGATDWAQYALQANSLGIPSQALRALPYLLALIVLVFSGKGSRAPQALGQPYEERA